MRSNDLFSSAVHTIAARLQAQIGVYLIYFIAQAHLSPDYTIGLSINTRCHIFAQAACGGTIDRHRHQIVRVSEAAETVVSPCCARRAIRIARIAQGSGHLVVAIAPIVVGWTLTVISAACSRLINASGAVEAWTVGARRGEIAVGSGEASRALTNL